MSLRIDCLLCGPSPARRFARDRGFEVVRCRGCGLLATWPRPGPDALEAVYARPEYYEEEAMGAEQAGAWRDRARGLLERVPVTVRRALDFGAGEGHGVAALRALGIAADGVETSPAGRAAARRLHGLELLERLPAGPADYDVVLLIQALEHVPDPVATLRELAGLTRPGGIVFIEVPHAGSLEMWRPRLRRHLLSLPAHLYHFTPETLARVVARAGLEQLEVHLINPDLLEWLFALRARRRGSAPDQAAPRSAARRPADRAEAGSTPAPAALPWTRALWGRRVLPWIRRRFPGWRFQVVARRPAAAR